MMEQKGRCVAIYSRKSKFTGRGESIGNQVELCRDYVREHFSSLDADHAFIFEDEGFSGGNLNRPRFREMMAAAKRGEISAIVVYRLDRISRNIGDFAGLIEELHQREISFVSIREQFDTESPMGRAMMYIASVFSQLERETTAERIRDNLHELAKTGRWLGGTTPTGYTSEEVRQITMDNRVRKACKLKGIPEELSVVRSIFETFLETNSLTQTDAYLLQNGVVTKNGKRFTRFAIRGILTNPVYMVADEDSWRYLTAKEVELFSGKEAFDGKHGIMAYNRTEQKKGKKTKLRPECEWIVSVGKHLGLVSGRDWVHVQNMLGQNQSKSYRKPRSHVALASGLLTCGQCGGLMRPKRSQRVNAQGEEIYEYVCTIKERSKSTCCAIHNVNGNQLDQALVEEMKRMGEDTAEFLHRLENSRKTLAESEEECGAKLGPMQAAVDANQREIDSLIGSLGKAAGMAAEDYIVQKVEELHRQGNLLKQRLREAKCLTEQQGLSQSELSAFCRKYSSLSNTVDDMTVEEKRSLLRSCVKKIIWDGEHAHVYQFGADVCEGLEESSAGVRHGETDSGTSGGDSK